MSKTTANRAPIRPARNQPLVSNGRREARRPGNMGKKGSRSL